METKSHHINYTLSPPELNILQTEKYILRIASSQADLESIFRLRFQVFNRELGLGYSHSHLTQMHQDKFDQVCHHLLLIDKNTDKTIGTYRMQTYTMAARSLGFDTADIFNLYEIPENVLRASVEVGCVCIAKEYRNSQTLLLLWEGLANYLKWSQKQYFFGCVSLPTQCPSQAACVYDYFQQNNLMHPQILLDPNSTYSLELPPYCVDECNVKIPNILQAYFSIGAKICSRPALDRQFKTIDFLIISNLNKYAKCFD
jgi:putative hemolysin